MLPPNGFYPAKWVDIFSNTDADYRYEDVEVVFIPRGAEGVSFDEDFWDEFADYNRRWLGDLGNSVAGWMEPGGLNPEKIFGGMLFYGFSNKHSMKSIVKEFAVIQECEWARQMEAGKFSKVLQASARGREAVVAALEEHSCNPWARDMLETMRSEAEY